VKKAIFLDRDGVLNRLVYNPATGEFEAPHLRSQFKLKSGITQALKNLQKNFLLFLISNQPDYAKGKTTLAELQAIHQKFHAQLLEAGIKFRDYFYCFHHPEGVVKGYARKCLCRKPSPYFIFKAQKKFRLDLKKSWLVGDQDSDIFCGQAIGIRTILINEKNSHKKRKSSQPDFVVRSLKEAAKIILGAPEKSNILNAINISSFKTVGQGFSARGGSAFGGSPALKQA
jgi:D-glycero-D-manno-heptose 1,7-bisphosphate phosphatase